MQSPQAGWYEDPELPGGHRFWDGSRWTEDRVPPPGNPPAPAPAEARARPARLSPAFWLGLVAIAGMIAGSFAPWASFVIDKSGTEGGDGWIVIALAITAAAVLVSYATGHSGPKALIWVIVMGAGGILVGVIDLLDITSREADILEVAWGLYLVIGASAALAVAAGITHATDDRFPSP